MLSECVCFCVMAPLQAGLGPFLGPLRELSIQATPISQECWMQRAPRAPAPVPSSPHDLPLSMVRALSGVCIAPGCSMCALAGMPGAAPATI